MNCVNNEFYNDLGEKWFEETNHPIALLRAENRLRNPWIMSQLKPGSKVVDLGCGAGLLTNALAQAGHAVVGIDLSKNCLEMAQRKDATKSVTYLQADASSTPLSSSDFDVVCAMDLLEHVQNPQEVIAEAARLLKPGGLFFFHTFNRTVLSYLFVIKGVEWFIKNVPLNMHVYRFFIRPKELLIWCEQAQLKVEYMKGVGLQWNRWATWKMALTRSVPKDLSFRFHNSLQMGYSGFAKKNTL